MRDLMYEALREGKETSEYKTARWAAIVSLIVSAVSLFWPDVPTEALREILLWVAGLIGGGASVGYIVSRAVLKARALKYGWGG
jgi:hypothetical protein